MTSKLVTGGFVSLFACGIALVFIITEPKDDLRTANLIVGNNGDSDVLILSSESAAVLPPQVNNVLDLWGITPVEFLKALKMERSATDEYVFREPIKNWVAKKDLPGLLALTESTEPCASVVLSLSAPIGNVHGSNMGQEALTLIEGYRKGEYPPAPSSGGYEAARAKALIDWCRSELAKPGN